jgi:anti-anti-sigma factor
MTAFGAIESTAAPPVDRVRFSTDWMSPSVVRISVAGDIDASNADQLAEYVFRRAANCRRLILDLQDVSFFGTAGFANLRTIGVRCADARVNWMLVPSRPVSLVLDVCDPGRNLPVAAS